MAETAHARSRRASLSGLVLQVLATLGLIVLAVYTQAQSIVQLAWLAGGGVPIWFVALLVFRQHELAALEAMDLEELRRAKRTAPGSEALFGEEGGGPGFLVAEARLRWMRRWLIPTFGLISAAYLIGAGVYTWLTVRDVAAEQRWPQLQHAPLALIISVVLFVLLFFYARYAAGLSRVREWQLLRGCGSYMQGNAIAALAVAIGLAIFLYQRSAWWEHGVAFVLPAVMVLLGAETVLNFVLDIYRPRAPGVEPRACFDSRLLGLICEPGGIAKSLADAINYQFGFEVSQTWFYQLLQRTFVPLMLVGALVIWLLTTLVIVQPYERSIIERLGRQLNAKNPLEPGLYFKWPAPFSRARKYNTDQLHEFVVGFKVGDQPEHKTEQASQEGRVPVELWTDKQHAGHEHFDFIIATPPYEAGQRGEAARRERAPVNLVRMNVYVQYRIRPDRLDAFTRNAADPHAIIRRIAWNEVVRLAASSHLDELMGDWRDRIGPELHRRIAARVEELGLGLEVVYVGVLQVHPEKNVAQAYRELINAQQQKIAEIRKARVEENKTLSKVAGSTSQARALVYTLDQVAHYEALHNDALRALEEAGVQDTDVARERLKELETPAREQVKAQWEATLAQRDLARAEEDFQLGLGRSLRQIEVARRRAEEAAQKADQARRKFEQAAQPLRRELAERYGPQVAEHLIREARARFALAFWNEKVEGYLAELEGDAAVALADAQARRWEHEMTTAGQVTRLEKERIAYQTAPRIYRVRSYLEVLVDGLKRARKYFLAFEPGRRQIKVRYEVQERARPELGSTPLEVEQK